MKKTILLFLLTTAPLSAQTMDPATCPMHEEHMKAAKTTPNGDVKHGAAVDARHDTLVASHATTRHSFRLFRDGGAIELRAIDRADQATIDNVRAHLKDIAAQFKKKDFRTPAFVHGREPAGIDGMTRLHNAIQFRYEPVEGGGRIRMTTANADALGSIHDFLKFQVVEHHTDNSSVVEEDK